jgi:AraC-like DNA-binding protein
VASDRGLEQTRHSGQGRSRGLVSIRVSGRRIDVCMLAPPQDLANVVERFWCGRWDLRGQPDHRTELLGDPSVHVVFEAGEARVVGVCTRLWTRTLQGVGSVRAVKLHLGAVLALLPDEARSYADRSVPLSECVRGWGEALVERVLGPDDDRVGVLALADWMRPRIRVDRDCERANELVKMISTTSVARVEVLATDVGLTVRIVQRLFRSHVGVPPKWVIRRYRLQEVAERVESGEATNLVDLAFELGYADQAHLARDFRGATGKTLRGFEDTVHR